MSSVLANNNNTSISSNKPPRPNVLSDPASLASLQNRLRERSQQQNISGVPVYELRADQQQQQTQQMAADQSQQQQQQQHSLLYSNLAGRGSSPSVVSTSSQCRSLRDRIYERTLSRSPLPPPVAGAVYNSNATKDVYAHEQPFPVQTVFEVQRIGNPLPEAERPLSASAPHLKQSDSILTDAESAAIIQALDAKLTQQAQAAAGCATENQALQTRVADAEGQIDGFRRAADEAVTRLIEAQAQCEAARQSIVVAVDAERQRLTTEHEHRDAETRAVYERRIQELTVELDGVKSSVFSKDNDNSSLFVLISDLQQAVRDGAERQKKNADIIARLDRELQESRSRAATVSTGFHAKEKQIRDASEKIELLTNDVNGLAHARDELLRVREELAVTRKQLDDASSELVPLRVTADEKTRYQNQCQVLENELNRKNDELAQLRSQVDGVRQQADAVYARSSNFNTNNNNNNSNGSVNGMMMMGGFPQQGGYPTGINYSGLPMNNNGNTPAAAALPMNNSSNDAMRQLRADIMAEDSRTEAERQKWKTGGN